QRDEQACLDGLEGPEAVSGLVQKGAAGLATSRAVPEHPVPDVAGDRRQGTQPAAAEAATVLGADLGERQGRLEMRPEYELDHEPDGQPRNERGPQGRAGA